MFCNIIIIYKFKKSEIQKRNLKFKLIYIILNYINILKLISLVIKKNILFYQYKKTI